MKRSIQTPATRSTLALLAASALALTLAACSGDSDGDATSSPETTEETTESEAPAEEETTEEETTAEETEAPAEASGDLAACVVGDWVMSEDAAREQALGNLGGVEGDMQVSGTSALSISPDSITQTVDQTINFAASMEGQEVTMEVVTDGSIDATYTIEGTSIVYGEITGTEGGMTMTSTTNGTPTTQEVLFSEQAAGLPGSTFDVVCSDTTLTMTAGGANAGEFTRQ